MKQKNGNALRALFTTSLMVATLESCLNSEAKISESFTSNGKIKEVNHKDSSISVDTTKTQHLSADECIRIHPIPTQNVRIDDSAKFNWGNNLPDGTTVVNDLTIVHVSKKVKKK